jgi:PAS domain S-box-containing protein
MSESTFSTRRLNILFIEDNPDDVALTLRAFDQAGIQTRAEVVQTAHEFCASLASREFDIVLADHRLPAWNGMEAVELLQQMEKDVPVILLTGALPDEQAAAFLQKGGTDYVLKDRMGRLPAAVRRAIEAANARRRRTELERRLQESEEWSARLAEGSPEALLIGNEEKVLFANAAAVQLLGAESERQLIDLSVTQLFHADCRGALREAFERLPATLRPHTCEARVLRLDGKPVDVKLAAVAVIYRGSPAVQITLRDADRRRVEAAIKSLSSFAELNPQPVLEFSRDGRLAYANAAATDLARALGKEHPSAIAPPDTLSIVQSCLSSGQKKLNVETTCGGHSLRWSFFPTSHNQSVHAYVKDLTEERKLEAQLRQAQRLEVAGRLATGIAHDFSNLLTVIQGHAGLLRAEANLSSATQESIQQIVRAAERAGKLSNQLLAFSRQTTLRPRAIDLNHVLAGMSTLLQRTIGEDIGVNFDFGANLPLVYADAHAIEQCVLSIAINAREAMAGGGQLLINTSIADINSVHAEHHGEARQGRFVCLTVVDSGPGGQGVSRLFNPVWTTKTGGGGFEFTLGAVKAIVQQHNGWIEVQSRIGEGTTLRIYLPLHAGPSQATAPPSRVATAHRETVLVVEDEAPVRSIVRTMLERSGFEVLEAASGIEALAIWHQHQADIGLLLTDLVMPGGLSGQEVAEKFRAQKPSLKVLYTSGYSPRAAGNGVLPDSGAAFLEKPFDAAQLAEAVRHSLEGAN